MSLFALYPLFPTLSVSNSLPLSLSLLGWRRDENPSSCSSSNAIQPILHRPHVFFDPRERQGRAEGLGRHSSVHRIREQKTRTRSFSLLWRKGDKHKDGIQILSEHDCYWHTWHASSSKGTYTSYRTVLCVNVCGCGCSVYVIHWPIVIQRINFLFHMATHCIVQHWPYYIVVVVLCLVGR